MGQIDVCDFYACAGASSFLQCPIPFGWVLLRELRCRERDIKGVTSTPLALLLWRPLGKQPIPLADTVVFQGWPGRLNPTGTCQLWGELSYWRSRAAAKASVGGESSDPELDITGMASLKHGPRYQIGEDLGIQCVF